MKRNENWKIRQFFLNVSTHLFINKKITPDASQLYHYEVTNICIRQGLITIKSSIVPFIRNIARRIFIGDEKIQKKEVTANISLNKHGIYMNNTIDKTF